MGLTLKRVSTLTSISSYPTPKPPHTYSMIGSRQPGWQGSAVCFRGMSLSGVFSPTLWSITDLQMAGSVLSQKELRAAIAGVDAGNLENRAKYWHCHKSSQNLTEQRGSPVAKGRFHWGDLAAYMSAACILEIGTEGEPLQKCPTWPHNDLDRQWLDRQVMCRCLRSRSCSGCCGYPPPLLFWWFRS